MPDDTPTKPSAGRSVLLVATAIWPLAARVAMAFLDQGWVVEVLCPPNNPIVYLTRLHRVHVYWPLFSAPLLARALKRSNPDLVIATDDRALGDLNRLRIASRAPGSRCPASVRAILERHHARTGARTRWDLTLAASAEAIAMPASERLDLSLDVANIAIPLPWALKVEGSWGGEGVRIVHNRAEASGALERLRSPPSCEDLRHRVIGGRDLFALRTLSRHEREREITVQTYIAGTPANCAIACIDGRVIDIVSVEVVRRCHELSPAMIVRLIDNATMREAATRLAGRFGLTGLFGFDFIIESGSGAAYLLEMNDRPTQICHLPLNGRGSLIASLSRAWDGTGQAPASGGLVTGDVVTLFPQNQEVTPWVGETYDDVPWSEPALIRRCTEV